MHNNISIKSGTLTLTAGSLKDSRMSEETESVETTETTTLPENHDEMVSKSELKKVLDDMMKFKKANQELQTQVKSYEQMAKEAEEKRLVEKEDYKNLYEQWKDKANKAVEEKNGLLKAFENDKKYEVIKRSAVKNGLRDEALDDLEYLDTSDVIIEKTDQGRINIIGADEFVDKLKERKPFWFNDSKAPTLNTSDGSPGSRPKELSASDILKLQKEKPEEYKRIIAKRLKGA